MSKPIALFNGAVLQTNLAFNRGLHYGDGVFRTLLRYDSCWIDWPAQMAKLREDAARIGLTAPDPALLLGEAESLCFTQAGATLKILLWRENCGRGYSSESDVAERLLLRYDVAQFPLTYWTQGVRAFLSPVTMATQPRLAGIKHLNRLEQVLASRDWPQEMQEGILLSTPGKLVCGTRSNLFWLARGQLFTPDLSECGVSGVMRGRIFQLAQQMEIEIKTGSYAPQDLLDADEAFVTNSLIGLWPLRQFETRNWNAPGALTRHLSLALAHPILAASEHAS